MAFQVKASVTVAPVLKLPYQSRPHRTGGHIRPGHPARLRKRAAAVLHRQGTGESTPKG